MVRFFLESRKSLVYCTIGKHIKMDKNLVINICYGLFHHRHHINKNRRKIVLKEEGEVTP